MKKYLLLCSALSFAVLWNSNALAEECYRLDYNLDGTVDCYDSNRTRLRTYENYSSIPQEVLEKVVEEFEKAEEVVEEIAEDVELPEDKEVVEEIAEEEAVEEVEEVEEVVEEVEEVVEEVAEEEIPEEEIEELVEEVVEEIAEEAEIPEEEVEELVEEVEEIAEELIEEEEAVEEIVEEIAEECQDVYLNGLGYCISEEGNVVISEELIYGECWESEDGKSYCEMSEEYAKWEAIPEDACTEVELYGKTVCLNKNGREISKEERFAKYNGRTPLLSGKKVYTVKEAEEALKDGTKFHVGLTYK